MTLHVRTIKRWVNERRSKADSKCSLKGQMMFGVFCSVPAVKTPRTCDVYGSSSSAISSANFYLSPRREAADLRPLKASQPLDFFFFNVSPLVKVYASPGKAFQLMPF